MRMKMGAALFAAALAGAAQAQAHDVATHGPPAAAASVLAADRAFSARSAQAGPGVAFAEYADPQDSRAFMSGDPLRGARAIAAAYGQGGALVWTPAEVFASQGGDMAATWGTWRFTPPASAKEPPVTGRYVTVWRKDPAGAWKAIVDIGAPDSRSPG